MAQRNKGSVMTPTKGNKAFPGKEFEQEKEDGRLSPLRSSAAWDATHNSSIKAYGRRSQ